MWRLVCAVGLCAGCYHANPAENQPCTSELTCPDGQMCDTGQNPPTCVVQIHDARVIRDAVIDAPAMGCQTSSDCMSASAAVCDPMTKTCRGCLQDSECPSHVCVESTAVCVDGANALFVAPTGSDANSCFNEAAPCLTISGALNKLTAGRRTIRVADGTYSESWLFGAASQVVISGQTPSPLNTVINFNAAGYGTASVHDHCVEDSGTPLILEGMTFSGAPMEGIRFISAASKATLFAIAVANSGGGVDCSNCDVTMMVVLIGNNTAGSGIGIAANGVTPIVRVERGAIGGNAGVGLQLGTATYTINNTFIVNNGGGGVTIGTPGAGSRFEFNTVVSNGGATLPTGMRCASTAQIASSIFSANGAAPQISDMCVATYSLFDDAAGQNNTGDKLGSPAFVSALDPHIQGTSPARNAADPAAVLNIDIDGEHRPQGANRDMGADEIP